MIQNSASTWSFITVWMMVFFIFSSLSGKAQAHSPSSYLQQTAMVDSLYSQILNESRTVYIQIPDSYEPSKNQKYPVAFILDGEIFLPTVHEVQKYYSGGFTPEMVLIGIANDHNRVRDLTPSAITTKYGMPFTVENGKAAQFLQFIEQELIPYIENKYPVTNYRTLIGHSYGGLFTIFSLLRQPDLFANYLATDPSLDWDQQKLLEEAKKILPTQDYQNKALFISLSGQLHMQDATITMDNVMQDSTDFTLFPRSNIAFSNVVRQNAEKGLTFTWQFYPRDIHGTVSFPSLMDGLVSLFEWYQMEQTDKINSFDTPIDVLSQIITYRAKKLKDHFSYPVPPYPEELLNMSGYMNLDMQQLDKARMYFELAITYFPESANALDAMADYYLAQEDLDKAMEYLYRAFTLSGHSYYKEKMETLRAKKK